MKNFNEALEKHMEKLVAYVPVVARVHGGTHPEFHDVKKIFDDMLLKIKNKEEVNLEDAFKQLRDITDNYTIPGDTCGTYEAVYVMLEDLDEAYRQDK